MEEVIIRGDTVVLREVSEVKRISTTDFHQQLMKSQNISTPILPASVIHFTRKDSKRIYVTMHKPQKRTIKILDGEITEHEIMLPFIYFIHEYVNNAFENLFIFCANKELDSDEEILCKVPLKNIHPSGRVCLGNDLRFNLIGKLKQKLSQTEAYFWNSNFNSDLDLHYMASAPELLEETPIENWAELSDDDFNPCEIDWKEYLPLDKILQEIVGIV